MDINVKDTLLSDVSDYYSKILKKHGENARGVDWNSEVSQILRFEQLCKMLDTEKRFTINDIGCGYGALYNYLADKYSDFDYLGVDISESMIDIATKRVSYANNARFIQTNIPDEVSDYSVASGIFNVKLGYKDEEWSKYQINMLNIMNTTSRYGFSFNCLSSYSDDHKKRSDLFYSDPCFIFDFCKINYSKNVSLLHDYGLYEFTIIVRKDI